MLYPVTHIIYKHLIYKFPQETSGDTKSESVILQIRFSPTLHPSTVVHAGPSWSKLGYCGTRYYGPAPLLTLDIISTPLFKHRLQCGSWTSVSEAILASSLPTFIPLLSRGQLTSGLDCLVPLSVYSFSLLGTAPQLLIRPGRRDSHRASCFSPTSNQRPCDAAWPWMIDI